MNTAEHQLALALAILPPLPAEVDAYRSSGAATKLRAYGTTEGRLQALMPWVDAHKESTLIIPIRNTDRGGYDVACQVTERYYESESAGRVELTVCSVSRLKPYRTVARAHLTQLALVSVVAGTELRQTDEFDTRLVDLSVNGFAIITERQLTRGDLISMTTHLDTSLCRVTARVVQVTPGPYGRRRIGCQIVEADAAVTRQLTRFLENKPTIPADRRTSDRAAEQAA